MLKHTFMKWLRRFTNTLWSLANFFAKYSTYVNTTHYSIIDIRTYLYLHKCKDVFSVCHLLFFPAGMTDHSAIAVDSNGK